MLRFYWRLCRTAVRELFNASERIVTALAVVLFLVTWFNRDIAKKLATDWEGLSRWWSIAPVLALVTLRLMKANYAAYESERAGRLQAEAQLRESRDAAAQREDPLVSSKRKDFQEQLKELNEPEQFLLAALATRPRLTGEQAAELLLRRKIIGGGTAATNAPNAESYLRAIERKTSFVEFLQANGYWRIVPEVKQFVEEWAASRDGN